MPTETVEGLAKLLELSNGQVNHFTRPIDHPIFSTDLSRSITRFLEFGRHHFLAKITTKVGGSHFCITLYIFCKSFLFL